MATSRLSLAVDTWTCQAVSASRFLQGLYRVLGDGRQAANAIQAGAPAEERGSRLGLSARISAFRAMYGSEDPDETKAEGRAWQFLVEAQAGICAFHAMVYDHEKGRSLQGSRTAANKAFQVALRGYRIAFPEEMSEPGISGAIVAAANTCVEAFLEDLEDSNEEERESLRRRLDQTIREALIQETGMALV